MGSDSLIFISTEAPAAQCTKIGSVSEIAIDVNIDVNNVVWICGGVVHVYDLASKKDTTTNSSAASHPAISGSSLVWHGENTGVLRLFVYDLEARGRSYITEDVDCDRGPAITQHETAP